MLHQTSKGFFLFWRAASIIQASCLDYSLNYKANKFCRLVFNCFVWAHLVHPDILFKSWIEHIIPEDIKMTCVIDLFWLSSVSTECSRALKLLFDSFQCGGIIPNPQHLLKHNSTHHVHLRSDYLTWDNINTPYSWTESETTQAHQKTKNMLIFASCSVLSETYEH